MSAILAASKASEGGTHLLGDQQPSGSVTHPAHLARRAFAKPAEVFKVFSIDLDVVVVVYRARRGRRRRRRLEVGPPRLKAWATRSTQPRLSGLRPGPHRVLLAVTSDGRHDLARQRILLCSAWDIEAVRSRGRSTSMPELSVG